MMAWMKDIAPKMLLRLAVGVVVFVAANFWYVGSGIYRKERLKFSPVAGKLDSAFGHGDVVYMGESSNTSFNPWTDTLGYSVSEFLQMYLPQNRVRGVSHDGYHVGLFSQMLGLMPAHWADSASKTVVITVNMRSFGPSAMFNGNEASNQQEAIFYQDRLALLNRVYVSLHHYDNRDAREMERAKTQWFRTKDLRLKGDLGRHYGLTHSGGDMLSQGGEYYYHNTVKWWLRDLQRQFAPVSGDADLARVMPMAEAYLKEFAFLLDEQNLRVQALDAIVAKCKREQVNVVFVLLMPNFDHANRLFGKELVDLMNYNMDFLRKRFEEWSKQYNKGAFHLGYVDVQGAYGDWAGGQHYTDQWYPTEHVDAHIRQFIAQKTAQKILEIQWRVRIQTGVTKPMPPVVKPTVNNWPNWNIKMPLADTCLATWNGFRGTHLR